MKWKYKADQVMLMSFYSKETGYVYWRLNIFLCTEKEKLKFIFSLDQKGQQEKCKKTHSFQSDASMKIVKYCLQLKVDTKNRMKS